MDALENLEARVEQYLGQLGLEGAFRPGGVTAIDAEGTVVLVHCFAQDDVTWLRVLAPVLFDVEPTLGLLHRLSLLDREVLRGGFRLFEDGALVFATTLDGDTVSPDAFERAVRYVAHVAASEAPALQAIAQGRTWSTLRQEATC